jgi:hypothetical protein
MARKALELPLLHMQLSEHFRLDQPRISYESIGSKWLQCVPDQQAVFALESRPT